MDPRVAFRHDVVIVGAGPTGMMLGAELGTYRGPWELPVLGGVPAPDAVLIRPDGYVAWVGEGSQAGLIDALITWFGS